MLRALLIILVSSASSPLLSHGVGDDGYVSLVPEVDSELDSILTPDDLAVVNGVVDRYKLWEPGQTLQVCFLDGASEVRNFFVETAGLWDDIASIDFDFGTEPSFRDCSGSELNHIRVSFVDGTGNWSYIGTDSITVPQASPSLTVAVGAAFELANKRLLAATILHELGHAIALNHEHQSPEANCEEEFLWDTIYSELGSSPNFWSREKVDHNMRPLTSSPRLAITEYDPSSIMHYYFPPRWFTSREESSCFIEQNTTISRLDQLAVEYMYPNVPQRQVEYFESVDRIAALTLSELNLGEDQLEAIETVIDRVANRVEERNYDIEDLSVILENVETNGECAIIVGAITGDIVINCP